MTDPNIPTDAPAAPGPEALLALIQPTTTSLLRMVEWAEAEIDTAARRHPKHSDLLYHAFAVLVPRMLEPAMGTPFVYRGHARELLERAVTGADLRPATAAEVCLGLMATSLRVPLHGTVAGLYFRMWLAAFPDHPVTADHADQQIHYERLHGPQIDALETALRRKLADPERCLGDITCSGQHHGTNVSCSYAADWPRTRPGRISRLVSPSVPLSGRWALSRARSRPRPPSASMQPCRRPQSAA